VLIAYPRPGMPWVKVTDFGLFQALEDVHGDGPNPAPAGGFRAPEYASNGDIDQRADVYSAAALLHALLHGVAPGREAETSSRVPAELTRVLAEALRTNPRERMSSIQSLANRLAPFAQESSRPTEVRLSSPPSIRWINNGPAGSGGLPLAGVLARGLPSADLLVDTPSRLQPRDVAVTESLLRNPRFPSDHKSSPWIKRWRSVRSTLASHPNMGAAWLFALASVGAGIACALLAAWMQ